MSKNTNENKSYEISYGGDLMYELHHIWGFSDDSNDKWKVLEYQEKYWYPNTKGSYIIPPIFICPENKKILISTSTKRDGIFKTQCHTWVEELIKDFRVELVDAMLFVIKSLETDE